MINIEPWRTKEVDPKTGAIKIAVDLKDKHNEIQTRQQARARPNAPSHNPTAKVTINLRHFGEENPIPSFTARECRIAVDVFAAVLG